MMMKTIVMMFLPVITYGLTLRNQIELELASEGSAIIDFGNVVTALANGDCAGSVAAMKGVVDDLNNANLNMFYRNCKDNFETACKNSVSLIDEIKSQGFEALLSISALVNIGDYLKCDTGIKTNVATGGDCTAPEECAGNTGLGQAGAFCCSGKCQNKVQDWAGVYYCPEDAVLKVPLGQKCALGPLCENYQFSGPGVECCWFTCQQRVEKDGWFGSKTWTCP